MARHTFFLTLRKSAKYPYLAATIKAKKPNAAAGEVVLALDVNVPDALFERPVLRAKIEVPDLPTANISTEVMAGISKAISDQLGIRVEIEPFNKE